MIEFKPKKSLCLQTKFSSDSLVTSGTLQTNKEVTSDLASYNTIGAYLDTTFSGTSSDFGVENYFKGDSGEDQKFSYLKYLAEKGK